MARLKFNTADLNLDHISILVHGESAAGKTWLVGDILKAYAPYSYLVNFAGEDGMLTLKNLSLPGETIETLADWAAFVQDVKMGALKDMKAIGFDGLTHFYRMVMRSVTEKEVPEPSDYQTSHPRFEKNVLLINRSVPISVWTARSDRSMDQVRQEVYITPDLPGRMAVGVAHAMDFVFFLEADAISPEKTRRVLYTAPKGKMVVRQRLPIALPPTIDDPTWAKIKTAIDKSGVESLKPKDPVPVVEGPVQEKPKSIPFKFVPITKKKESN